jgi:hypothetical protein
MKHIKKFEAFDVDSVRTDGDKFNKMVSTDKDDRIPVGNYITFKYYINNEEQKYSGKVIDNSKYHKVVVSILNRVDDKGKVFYNSKSAYKEGDEVTVHIGNILNSNYKNK